MPGSSPRYAAAILLEFRTRYNPGIGRVFTLSGGGGTWAFAGATGIVISGRFSAALAVVVVRAGASIGRLELKYRVTIPGGSTLSNCII